MTTTANWISTITFRSDGRFTFFYCQNFFSKVHARALLDSFPLSHMESVRNQDAAHSTISTSRHPELFRQIIAEHKCWQEVHATVTSKEFVASTLSGFRDAILRRHPPLIRTIFKRSILNQDRYYSEMQFSVRWTGSILSPHTDNADKVLALVCYLPEENQEADTGGTAFYSPRSKRSEMKVFQRYVRLGLLASLGLRRLRSTKLPTSDSFKAREEVLEHLEFFDANYQMVFDAPFHLGSAGGFIKNQYSWHDVRLSDFVGRAPRRSLLVNVMLRPSKARALTNRLLLIRRPTPRL